MKKVLTYFPTILFAGFLLVFSLCDLLAPPKEFSEMENRLLAQTPTPTVRSLLNNGYTNGIEKAVDDQFLWRNQWITLKSISETALGKQENNGVVYGADGYLFEKLTALDPARLSRSMQQIQLFASAHPSQRMVLTIVPNAYAMMPQHLPKGLELVDQNAWVEEIYAQAAQWGMQVWDVRPVFAAHQSESALYYRTDHHWTTRAAYLSYAGFVRSQGLDAIAWEALELHERDDFLGTLYSKSKLYSATPDPLVWYDVQGVDIEVNGEAQESVYDFAQFDTRDKYAAFLHSNNALTVLRNKSAPTPASRILLIKDSYGNCYAPLLAFSYDEVYIVDLRYFRDMEQLLATVEFDVIHLLYNFTTFVQDSSFHLLNA
jgi:hypothetical protein